MRRIKPQFGVGRRAVRQAEGQRKFKQRAGDQRIAERREMGQDFIAGGGDNACQMALEENRKDKDAGQNGDGRYRLHQPVGAGQARDAHQFLDVAKLGRRVDGGLHAQQQRHAEGEPEPAVGVAHGNQRGEQNGRRGRQFHHLRFGVTVRQIARTGEEKHEGQQDQPVQDGGEGDLGGAVEHPEHGVLDDDLVAEVDEGVEEHHRDKRSEAAQLEQT